MNMVIDFSVLINVRTTSPLGHADDGNSHENGKKNSPRSWMISFVCMYIHTMRDDCSRGPVVKHAHTYTHMIIILNCQSCNGDDRSKKMNNSLGEDL